jgi:hypothetical protein
MTQIQQILMDLTAAQVALRDSSKAFDEAVAGLRIVLDAIATANHAQGKAIDAVIAATNKGLTLFNGGTQ